MLSDEDSNLILAAAAFMQDAYPSAESSAREALSQAYSFDAAILLCASISLQDRKEESFQLATRMASDHPDDPLAWINQGRQALRFGLPKVAQSAAQRAIDLDPQSSHAWLLMGESARELGQREESISSFEKVVNLNEAPFLQWAQFFLAALTESESTALDYLSNHGESLGKLGEGPSAFLMRMLYLDHLQGVQEFLVPGRSLLADRILRHRSLDARRDYREALRLARELVASHPSSGYSHYALGQSLHRSGRLWPSAQSYQKAAELLPWSYRSQVQAGKLCARCLQPRKALGLSQRALMLRPDSRDALAVQFWALLLIGRWRQAATLIPDQAPR